MIELDVEDELFRVIYVFILIEIEMNLSDALNICMNVKYLE